MYSKIAEPKQTKNENSKCFVIVLDAGKYL